MEEQGAGGREAGGRGGITAAPAYTRLHGVRRDGVGGVLSFVLSFVVLARFSHFVFPFVISLVRCIAASWDRPGRRAKEVLATSHHCADSGQETDCIYSRHDLHRSHASNG